MLDNYSETELKKLRTILELCFENLEDDQLLSSAFQLGQSLEILDHLIGDDEDEDEN